MYLAIDLGSGEGTKITVFPNLSECHPETVVHIQDYGPDFNSYSCILDSSIKKYLNSIGVKLSSIRSIGIAAAGILKSDGTFQLIQNLSQFNNHNLCQTVLDLYGKPTAIDNDANAGAMAEWSVLRMELLYWVFGGGWGGAWVSRNGEVRFPSTEWDGRDESLHISNEPGYAISFNKLDLKTLFSEIHASYERFEQILLEESGEKAVIGPGGNPDTLRAETILSGPGRCRLFRAIVGDDDFFERFLDPGESKQMDNTSIAGKHISKLSSMRVEAAINTDRLFGKILARATREILRQGIKDNMSESIPVCLGGKSSYALPYFGPSTQRLLGKMGYMTYLRPSVIDERGINANLLGAAVLAARANGDI